MFVIAGVSGNTGSVVADTLLSQGKKVRVIVRDAKKGEPWKAKGAEVAVAELEDQAALTKAFQGATGAYVLIPPRPTSKDPIWENKQVSQSIAGAVKAAKVPHVVLLSSIGAQHAEGNGPIKSVHFAERDLLSTGANVTAVRAGYFQENWGGSLGAVAHGILPTFMKADTAIPMVATPDIGRAAATALVEGGKGFQILELGGPKEYTSNDAAAAVSKLVGKEIKVQEAPLDAVVPTFTGFGLSKEFSELFREMYAGVANGTVTWQGARTRLIRGTVTLEDTLKKLLGK